MPQAMLVSFSVLALFLQSQPPAPTATESAYKDQGKAAPEKPKAKPDQNSSEHSSSDFNKGGAEVASGNQQQSAHDGAQKATPNRWSVANTALNTIFTGLLVWLMFRQWRAMRQQAEYMREGLSLTQQAVDAAAKSANAATLSANTAARALEVSERADLLLSKASVPNMPIGPSSEVVLEFRNFGRTRALNIQFNMRLEIPDVPTEDAIIGPTVIGAGDSQQVRFKRFGSFLNEETANRIRSGSIVLRFIGTVSYEDVFGKQHTASPSGVLHPWDGTFAVETIRAD